MTTKARRTLILEAAHKAGEIRNHAHLNWLNPVCPFDLADTLGLDVRFSPIESMEGMYMKGNPSIIVVSSLRPSGRQAFTCAHEIGHHVFGHGTRLDELIDKPVDTPEELLADSFAAHLLMPKTGVYAAFTSRGWNPQDCLPEQVFTVAGWFGVGYDTLLNHMCWGLNIISASKFNALDKTSPKVIRERLFGQPVREDIVVVDEFWNGSARAIDLRVGDYILVPSDTFDEQVHNTHCLVRVDNSSSTLLFRAIRTGLGRLIRPQSNWAAFVRIRKKEFEGRSIYRHLEDPDEE